MYINVNKDSSVEIVGIFSKTKGKKVFRKTSFSLCTSEKLLINMYLKHQ